MSTAPIVPIDANDPDTMPRLLRQWETATPTVQGLFGHSFKTYIQAHLGQPPAVKQPKPRAAIDPGDPATVAKLHREWVKAPALARRIFGNNFAQFVQAHPVKSQ